MFFFTICTDIDKIKLQSQINLLYYLYVCFYIAETEKEEEGLPHFNSFDFRFHLTTSV